MEAPQLEAPTEVFGAGGGSLPEWMQWLSSCPPDTRPKVRVTAAGLCGAQIWTKNAVVAAVWWLLLLLLLLLLDLR